MSSGDKFFAAILVMVLATLFLVLLINKRAKRTTFLVEAPEPEIVFIDVEEPQVRSIDMEFVVDGYRYSGPSGVYCVPFATAATLGHYGHTASWSELSKTFHPSLGERSSRLSSLYYYLEPDFQVSWIDENIRKRLVKHLREGDLAIVTVPMPEEDGWHAVLVCGYMTDEEAEVTHWYLMDRVFGSGKPGAKSYMEAEAFQPRCALLVKPRSEMHRFDRQATLVGSVPRHLLIDSE